MSTGFTKCPSKPAARDRAMSESRPYPVTAKSRVAAHEGSPQPVRRLDGLPAEQILRVEATVIDAVIGTAADSDDPAVTDRELETVAVRVQHRGTGHPALDVLRLDAFGENAVDAHRPPLTRP